VVVGSIAKLGARFQLDARVIDSVTGRRLASASATAAAEEDLTEALDSMAEQLARQLNVEAHTSAATSGRSLGCASGCLSSRARAAHHWRGARGRRVHAVLGAHLAATPGTTPLLQATTSRASTPC